MVECKILQLHVEIDFGKRKLSYKYTYVYCGCSKHGGAEKLWREIHKKLPHSQAQIQACGIV